MWLAPVDDMEDNDGLKDCEGEDEGTAGGEGEEDGR